jgi:very-short-patch-repair endonuclease
MDKQVVEFAENNPSAAKTIKTIIKNKERFPKDEFEKLKKAFPCIIAGIRDYADYIPLESDIVDLVIIDEASQVSIAQAFPAILRAKKILVMGDKKQFSNIKSNQAANITNNEYLNGLKDNFFQNIGRDPSQTQRLTKFDIKTSILDFFEFIHNYRTMLKKHFRGYPELISYSSKYFYDDSLQAVKVRGKLIDDVLKFEVIEHDDKVDLLELQNSNKLESDFIISKLKEMKKNGDKLTVGIITPFTNQQKFITSEISKLEEAEYFYEELRLKVMTFDGSQGEERDYIFYSMVVTPLKDNLNSIFIKSLANRDLEEDASMRVARLNVGFSRAKECMHFVLSKPIMEYTDEIGTAIKHYYRKLEDVKKGPDIDDVDKNSPMEAKVLSWIRETSFYNNNSENIDLQAQFPVGEYLKQIEKYYTHPKYKTDFLLSYKDDKEKYHQIIIEYDGFEYHFRNKEMVNELNYNHYYNEDDVYREKVLESYGYSFLRINRFNLGKEPVQTLNERLEKIVQKKSLQVR